MGFIVVFNRFFLGCFSGDFWSFLAFLRACWGFFCIFSRLLEGKSKASYTQLYLFFFNIGPSYNLAISGFDGVFLGDEYFFGLAIEAN